MKTETVEIRPETIGATNATVKASNWKEDGWNGAAIAERIKFMKYAVRFGMVATEYLKTAHETVENLESQLSRK